MALIKVLGAAFISLRQHSIARALVDIEAAARARCSPWRIDIDRLIDRELATVTVHRPIAEISTI